MSVMSRRLIGAALLLFVFSQTMLENASPEGAAAETDTAVRSHEQIEADWLRQDIVRKLPSRREVPAGRP